MAEYYVNSEGSETYPFDTPAKGAHGLNRLAKYMYSNNYTLFNHDVSTSDIWQLVGVETDYPILPPFPTGSEQVIFTLKLTEHETYDRAEFSSLGTSRITFGKYSFATFTEVDGEYWSPYVRHTHTIQYELANVAPVVNFTKTWDTEVEYIFVVTPTELHMCIGNTSNVIYSVNHGVDMWTGIFNYAHYETRNGQPFYRTQVYLEYSTLGGGVRSVNRTHINTMESHLSSPLTTVPFTTDDIIYVCGDITERAGLYVPDVLISVNGASDTPFNGATVCSWPLSSKNVWTLASNTWYNNLCPSNIEINGSSASDTYFTNISKDITGLIFGGEFEINNSSSEKIVISDNIFYQDALISLDTSGDVDIFNNQFTYGAGIEITGTGTGLYRIFNNVFRDIESWTCINVYAYEVDLNLLIANNTFYRLIETYSIYVYAGFWDAGSKLNLKIFNNLDVSLATEGYGMYLETATFAPEDLIAFIHNNNCAPVFEYYDGNYDPFDPDVTEILEVVGGDYFDPSYEDPENPFYPLILLNSSPCYGTGLSSLETPELDYLGAARKAPPDMGAYEKLDIAPIVNFTSDVRSGNIDLTVQFIDTTVGPTNSWLWDFGDGGTSTEQNPTHVYTVAGTYTVTLTVDSLYSYTQEQYIDALSVVLADFMGTPVSGYQPLLVQYTDLSTPLGAITAWDWDFGDNTPHSTEQSPLHSYVSPGVYTVTLLVANSTSNNQMAKINYIEVIYSEVEDPEPESPSGGGFMRSRGPTLIFD